MSQVDHSVDLDGLARTDEQVRPPNRSWLRWAVPLSILAAFGWVLRDSLAELLRDRVEVTVVRPMRLDGSAPYEGEGPRRATPRVAVQAAGWVEPDPFPTLVPALAGGVLEEILVQESDVVAGGDPVARVIDEDARLAVNGARAEVARRQAAVELAQVRERIAKERFEAALEVTEAARIASARRVGSEAELELREAAIAEGLARLSLAESEIDVQRELDAAGASGARQVEIAEAEVEVASARLAALRAEVARTTAQARENSARDERATGDLEHRFDDRLARDESAATVQMALAELEHARASAAAAELRLQRSVIRAPRAGVVLERLSTVGDVLAIGAPVCSLFDPSSVRVRVDVAQPDVTEIQVGQTAEILADARPGQPYSGEVIRLVQRADIQKVTLEAQVRVLDADGLLRPDMLAQVRFLTTERDGAQESQEGSAGSGRIRVAVPTRLAESGVVWVVDPMGNQARRVEVQLGTRLRVTLADGTEEEWAEVLGGVNLTDKVVDEGRASLAAADEGDGVAVDVRRDAGAAAPQGTGGTR